MIKFNLCLCFYLIINCLLYSENISSTLDEYIHNHNEYVSEGHICNGTIQQVNFFISLLKNYPQIKKIAEIGFNAGHSSNVFLSARKDINVISFDIMNHSYVKVGKEYIDLKYPNRHQLIEGNSLNSVKAFYKKNPDIKFDLIFIDGEHSFNAALKDIINMKNLASLNTLLVVDDIKYKSVLDAWEYCLKKGYVKEIKRYSIENKTWVLGKYCFF